MQNENNKYDNIYNELGVYSNYAKFIKYHPSLLNKARYAIKSGLEQAFINYLKSGKKSLEFEDLWSPIWTKLEKYFNNADGAEQTFFNIWNSSDSLEGLAKYIYKIKSINESSDKYVKAFRESCEKLEEDIYTKKPIVPNVSYDEYKAYVQERLNAGDKEILNFKDWAMDYDEDYRDEVLDNDDYYRDDWNDTTEQDKYDDLEYMYHVAGIDG